MKYIKSFEARQIYKIGDYVKTGLIYFYPNITNEFLSKNIGQIINIKVGTTNNRPTKFYYVKYNNVPKNVKDDASFMDKSLNTPTEIILRFNNKQLEHTTEEEVKQYKLEQTTNKYNL